MSDILSDLNKAIENFSEHLYQITQILLVNPEDGIHLKLDEFPDNVILITKNEVEKGQCILVKDGPLKRSLYDFCKKHPEKIFRGKKI